jgi:hypothetical protein
VGNKVEPREANGRGGAKSWAGKGREREGGGGYIRSNLWSMREKTSAMAVELEIMHTARMTRARSPTTRDNGRRPVVDSALEAGRAPVDELVGALGLDGRDGDVDVLRVGALGLGSTPCACLDG